MKSIWNTFQASSCRNQWAFLRGSFERKPLRLRAGEMSRQPFSFPMTAWSFGS